MVGTGLARRSPHHCTSPPPIGSPGALPSLALQPVPLRRGRGPNGNRLPLQQFLRLIGGGRLVDPGGAAATNEQLLQNLRRGGVIQRWGDGRGPTPRPHPCAAPATLAQGCCCPASEPWEAQGWDAWPDHHCKTSACLPDCPSPSSFLSSCSDRVNRALRICARNLFVPAAYQEEAFVDAPIRVEEHGATAQLCSAAATSAGALAAAAAAAAAPHLSILCVCMLGC